MATETETNVTRTRHLDATRMSRGVAQEKSIDIAQVRNLDVTANPAALGLTAVGLKTCSRPQATHRRQRGGVGISQLPAVSEAAIIGKPVPAVKEEIIKPFLVLTEGYNGDAHLTEALKEHVRHEVGPVAVVGEIVFASTLPKTQRKDHAAGVTARELGTDELDATALVE